MSINDQVAGWEPVAFLRCEKIQSTEFLNKPDVFAEFATPRKKFFETFSSIFSESFSKVGLAIS